MTRVRSIVGLSAILFSSQAPAENWVTVVDYDQAGFFVRVDKDSIHRGADNLVYFTSDGIDKIDRAADCKNRIIYILKNYVLDDFDYSKWRDHGRAVVPGSTVEAELQFACANA